MTHTLTLDVPSTSAGLIQLVTEFRTFATGHDVPAPIQRDLHAAIDELVANLLQYGQLEGSEHRVMVRIGINADLVEVELVDDGQAFDPRKAIELPPADQRVGGVGLRLARHWLDELDYRFDSGRNHTTLRKRMHASAR